MKKLDLDLLEMAFDKELEAAMYKRENVFQTKSKRAAGLVASGHLREVVRTIGRFTISGYNLTLLGHAEYCCSIQSAVELCE